jgi:hypothetical protein
MDAVKVVATAATDQLDPGLKAGQLSKQESRP